MKLPLLLIFILTGSLLQAGPLRAEDAFRDTSGNEIYLPQNKSVISFTAPGVWQSVADLHEPVITTKIRHEGLENVRALKIRLPYPVVKNDPDPIKSVYILDKDGLIVAYYAFSVGEQEIEVSLNGVINYVRILIECPLHGLWEKNLRF